MLSNYENKMTDNYIDKTVDKYRNDLILNEQEREKRKEAKKIKNQIKDSTDKEHNINKLKELRRQQIIILG